MAKVNIYKIDEDRHRAFKDNMTEKLTLSRNRVIAQEEVEGLESDIVFTLYRSGENDNKNVSWEWILSVFEDDILQTKVQPRAVVVVEYEDEMYALTFGHSYFLVDKYCDRNFAFSFARKMNYKEIRTTALTSPNSQRNKTINTYIDYSSLEFDSGESFTKLKAKVSQPTDFDLYSELIEVGNSLKFTLKENSIQSICKLIIHIIEILAGEDIYKIPVFSKISDKELLEVLDKELEEEIQQGTASINISEIDIIGATEIFNNNDTTFTIGYKGKSEEISILSQEEIDKFTKKNELEMHGVLLDIKVVSYYNGAPVRTDKIRNLIDYVNDERRCILSKGDWYHFNDDYQEYLEDSIAEIDVIYNPDYDFTVGIHDDFIGVKYLEEGDDLKYEEMEERDVLKKLKQKYYAERVFNTIREQKDGFTNYDREEERVGQSKVELMDLYKDQTMYAVKIGNASSKLCYAVDQSISSLRLYKHNSLEGMPVIKNVAVWFILERKTKLGLENGKPTINELDMLMLKNKLDIWKKEVRVLGYNPVIYINYRS
ncbi:DUF6119 family protein [Sporosarcina sp. 6E9]|uniref:DUF6119 family protein n=1 Tax=Sporosarcina sp. 6E9 TaxID=2819235 RepID=UPI001B31749E|nr:DUF6119 family protein [Sporosarcina sp. 6E9]